MYRSSSVDYMGVGLSVVTQDLSGFRSTAIITDENGDGQATGALGCFATEAQARQFAVEYAKSEIGRRRLVTLPIGARAREGDERTAWVGCAGSPTGRKR